ncbi:hypothetical protein CLAFUW4_08075 [Fulvia fulva]|uniref:Uncharacterized protein n=1 Tax=Passalora fulva TaxID=5499 RepID=A0A9Q8P6E5_PASFU|nr:uncharacterized protein CLAFUR5_08193 [Fulvia fulva]KAK4628884.1 hypothetical protein CLAFUR4_08080 [Fulvia fulva]KAK4630444.1 hypothetical protein CLAFUR0_08075 [Fulvia fulva]UJO14924.1 hypothetical protein CLAFUR5_08193 [Fulvia fulva]WPV12826.1 hypothetical protein CLAFUW4_08075 [Fulvia fulva]WPV27005.1 hypothetical protein CLAFUW7_08075 [Fulvia fulva]
MSPSITYNTITDDCSLTTYPPTTVGNIVFSTADVRCLCGSSMVGLYTYPAEDYVAAVKCATTKSTTSGLIFDTGATPPPKPPHLRLAVVATNTMAPPSTTQFSTDGCSLSTYPAGTIEGIVFPTADVKCQCGEHGAVMAGVSTWTSDGTAFTACATAAPTTSQPLTTSISASSATVQLSTATTTMGEGHAIVTQGAGGAEGGGPFDAQTAGAKGKMGFAGALAAGLALAATFAML